MYKLQFLSVVSIFLLSCGGGSGSEDSQFCADDLDCPATHYCQYENGKCAANGECALKPEVCAEIFSPVCSCSGIDYPNACVAAQSGASVDFLGSCNSNP